MTVFKLYVDSQTRYVESTQDRLRKAMYDYIRAERAKGRKLSEITYCWTPIRIGKI